MMKRNSMKKVLSVFGVLVLVAAMALFAVGCGSKTQESSTKAPTETQAPTAAETQAAAPETEAAPAETEAEAKDTVLGVGSTVFTFVAVDLEGQETRFEIHTDSATLGDALLENQLIEGEMGEYGLYVQSVNGIPLDWEKDGKYWSLLIDGEYAMTGVDATEIVAGTTYTFLPAE